MSHDSCYTWRRPTWMQACSKCSREKERNWAVPLCCYLDKITYHEWSLFSRNAKWIETTSCFRGSAVPVHLFESQYGQFFGSFSPEWQQVKHQNQESRGDCKVLHVLLTDREGKKLFFTLQMDHYYSIIHFLQDKLTLLSNRNILLFHHILVIFKSAGRPSWSGPDILYYTRLYYNVAKRDLWRHFWSAACKCKGKECHKTVLKYSRSVLLHWEVTGKSKKKSTALVFETVTIFCQLYFTSPSSHIEP